VAQNSLGPVCPVPLTVRGIIRVSRAESSLTRSIMIIITHFESGSGCHWPLQQWHRDWQAGLSLLKAVSGSLSANT